MGSGSGLAQHAARDRGSASYPQARQRPAQAARDHCDAGSIDHDARDRAHRRLLHDDPPRTTWPRRRPRGLLAQRGAGRRVPRALGRPRVDHRPRGGHPPPGDRRRGRRGPELHARGGRLHRGRRRQGDPVHEAARTNRRGGEADARHGRARGRVRRLPRGPVLHAEDAQGDPLGRRPERSGT